MDTDKIFIDSIIDTIPEKLKLNDLFPCKRCGICCKGSNASMLSEELIPICRNLNIDVDKFRKQYATPETQDNIHGIRLNIPCPFFEDNDKRCKIYPIRPMSCRLYPFVSLMIMVKPCKKGLDIYRVIEDWYGYKNEKNIKNINEENNKENLKMLGNLINDFYSRIPAKCKYQYDSKILTDMELEEILLNDEIKHHGITIMPQKDELKKLLKFLKKTKMKELRNKDIPTHELKHKNIYTTLKT